MAFRLLLKRVDAQQQDQQPLFSAMLWSVEGADTRLLEWKDFTGTVPLGVWLAGVAGRHGRQNVSVDWTDQLRADARLTEIVAGIFGPPPAP